VQEDAVTDDPVIRTDALTKMYGRVRGILEIDLEVRPGEVFGYLGPNGAGKSTTIRTLLDLIRPSTGTARLFGLDSHRDSLAIRRRVGYVPGELHLYDSLSGRELVRYFGGLRGGLDDRRVRTIADRLECDLTRELRDLSHGNRQKVALLQAFASDPELLILDEPTNGLDPIGQQAFQGLIADAHGAGCTVFLSSHVMSEVERLCDRVAIIREGRLVAVERVDALKARAVRRVEIRFGGPVPAGVFHGLPGVSDLVVADRVVRCATSGSLDPLMKVANRFEIVDILASEPTLEEIVLDVYARGLAPTGLDHAA
jgi:ABC-2 type transport system ATP-binding protein